MTVEFTSHPFPNVVPVTCPLFPAFAVAFGFSAFPCSLSPVPSLLLPVAYGLWPGSSHFQPILQRHGRNNAVHAQVLDQLPIVVGEMPDRNY